jgi:hypothetical protein
MTQLTPEQVQVLMSEAVDERGVDLGQIRAQILLTPAQRVDWLIEALNGLEPFRKPA